MQKPGATTPNMKKLRIFQYIFATFLVHKCKAFSSKCGTLRHLHLLFIVVEEKLKSYIFTPKNVFCFKAKAKIS